MNGNSFAHLGGHLGRTATVSAICFQSAAIDCNRNMHISKAGALSENTAFEMGILLLQSMAAENTAETVASSYLPR